MSPTRIEGTLPDELDQLQARLMEMMGLVERQVGKAVDAFLHRTPEGVEEIRKDDERVDAMEVELDERVVSLIALHQPVASDLRRLLATMRISNDVERIGDHACNIAKAARRLGNSRPIRELPALAELTVLSGRMLQDALAAYASRNPALARDVCARDDRVDELKRSLQRLLTELMGEEPQAVVPAMEYVRVAQQLERIGDLSTNISEEVVFLVEGRSIKHGSGGVGRGEGR